VQLRIRSPQELFAALVDDDVTLRTAVLRAVASAPERALAFGRHAGRDVVDVLLDRARRATGHVERRALLATLAAFRDPRATELALDLLATSDDPVTMRIAAECLARASDLPLAARIRRTVLADDAERSREPPASHELTGWLRELEGPLSAEVRAHLEAHGEPVCTMLAAHWNALSGAIRGWLLTWSAHGRFEVRWRYLANALGDSEPLLLRALALLADEVEERPPDLQRRIDELAHDERVSVRAAAIRTGAQGIAFEHLLAKERNTAVREACVRRIGQARVPSSAAFLAAYLGDPDWRVRASTAEALIMLGGVSVDAVRNVLASKPPPETVAAAAQVLLSLADDPSVAAPARRA
jgi:HEAT repeat protein